MLEGMLEGGMFEDIQRVSEGVLVSALVIIYY